MTGEKERQANTLTLMQFSRPHSLFLVVCLSKLRQLSKARASPLLLALSYRLSKLTVDKSRISGRQAAAACGVCFTERCLLACSCWCEQARDHLRASGKLAEHVDYFSWKSNNCQRADSSSSSKKREPEHLSVCCVCVAAWVSVLLNKLRGTNNSATIKFILHSASGQQLPATRKKPTQTRKKERASKQLMMEAKTLVAKQVALDEAGQQFLSNMRNLVPPHRLQVSTNQCGREQNRLADVRLLFFRLILNQSNCAITHSTH